MVGFGENVQVKIFHLIDCYQKKKNKTKVDSNPNQIGAKRFGRVFCPELNFKAKQDFFFHIVMEYGDPRRGQENCREIYECTVCGVVKNLTLHHLMQHLVECHQEELRQN